MTARHPFLDAYIPPLGDGAADNVSEAVEAYAPMIAFSVDEITSRSLPRTRHIVLITGNAIRFYKQDTGNTDPPNNDTVIHDSDDKPFVLIQRGDRYDMAFPTTGLFGDGEELPAYSVPTALTLPAALPGSIAFCDVAPTSTAVVTFKKKTGAGAWATVFTVTFNAGQTTGVFALAADAALAAGDRLRPVTPTTHDPTFSGFTATVVATR